MLVWISEFIDDAWNFVTCSNKVLQSWLFLCEPKKKCSIWNSCLNLSPGSNSRVLADISLTAHEEERGIERRQLTSDGDEEDRCGWGYVVMRFESLQGGAYVFSVLDHMTPDCESNNQGWGSLKSSKPNGFKISLSIKLERFLELGFFFLEDKVYKYF